MKTKVIFRKFPDDDIVALFPEIPGNNQYDCLSYMHVGQHGAASPNLVQLTKPASAIEYADLLEELQSIGYDDLRIVKRFNYKDFLMRVRLNKKPKNKYKYVDTSTLKGLKRAEWYNAHGWRAVSIDLFNVIKLEKRG